MKKATSLIEKISLLPTASQVKFKNAVEILNKSSSLVSTCFSIYLEKEEPLSHEGRVLKDALIDLHEFVLDTEWNVDAELPEDDGPEYA